MILISQSLVLTPAAAGAPLNTPIFGWRNVAESVQATSEADGAPASLVLNPSTALRWRPEPGSPPQDNYLTFFLTSDAPVDYVAIAGHNLSSAETPVSIEAATEMAGSPPGWDWTELVGDAVLPNDSAALFRFPPQSLAAVRVRLQPGVELPFIAVVYVGKLLVLDRGTHGDVTPINMGRTTRVTNARSEAGHFLGRIVLSESLETAFDLALLRADWYRSEMDPFVVAAKVMPFFFAWKPAELPGDVGYCWMTNDPQPVISFETGRISISLHMGAASI
jgi:hypothetical protein